MSLHNKKLTLLLHSLVFKLKLAEDEEEYEVLMDVWESAMDTWQHYIDEMKRIEDERKSGQLRARMLSLSDKEKEKLRFEQKLRNAKWN